MPLPSAFHRIVALAFSVLVASCATPGDAVHRSSDIEAAARVSLAHFEASPGFSPALQFLPQASAVVILPRVVSASFVVGGSEAAGLLYVRDLDTGHWVGPVFYSLTQASVGLQAGVSTAEVLMIINSPGALKSLLKGRPRVGIDASAAVVKGGGASSAITSDVDSYALTRGLAMGIALDGSALHIRNDLNAAWYGQAATAEDIVLRRTVSRPGEARLATAIDALSRR